MTNTDIVGVAAMAVIILAAYHQLRIKLRAIGKSVYLPSVPEMFGVLFYWWARFWYSHAVAYDNFIDSFRRAKNAFDTEPKIIFSWEKKQEMQES